MFYQYKQPIQKEQQQQLKIYIVFQEVFKFLKNDNKFVIN